MALIDIEMLMTCCFMLLSHGSIFRGFVFAGCVLAAILRFDRELLHLVRLVPIS